MLRGFSWEHGYHRCRRSPGGLPFCPASARRVDLPARLGTFAVQRTIPSVRGCVTSPSPHRSLHGCRNFYRLSIDCASRLCLRSRLTLIRLALIRNPWSYGGRVSRPPCRYLFLHLLFPPLQQDSRLTFGATGMLPYQL